MSKIDDGGPAFPLSTPAAEWAVERVYDDGTRHPAGRKFAAGISGMSLRDYMAAKALPAIYSCAMKEAAEGSGLLEHPDWPIGLARDAYRMADAMLLARGVKA